MLAVWRGCWAASSLLPLHHNFCDNKLRIFIMKKTAIISLGTLLTTVAGSASAGIDQSTVDAIVTGITADAGIAIAAGFSILAVVLGARVGFGLVKNFIAAGAN